MHLSKPRISPVHETNWTEEQYKVLSVFAERKQLFNIYTTLAHNPDALKSFLSWGSFVLRRTSLSGRDRELIILRVGYLCRSGYEWAQHRRLGLREGLSSAEIEEIKIGPKARSWNENDKILLQATDELHRDQFISDSTWEALAEILIQTQCMDLVFIVGHYTQVCMMLNSFGVQLDEGLSLDKDLNHVKE